MSKRGKPVDRFTGTWVVYMRVGTQVNVYGPYSEATSRRLRRLLKTRWPGREIKNTPLRDAEEIW